MPWALLRAWTTPSRTSRRAPGNSRAQALTPLSTLSAACSWKSQFDALKVGGVIATIASPRVPIDLVVDRNLALQRVLINNNGDRTRQLAAQLANHALRPGVSHLLPLAEAAKAHRVPEGKHSGGKVSLSVQT